MNRLKKTAGSVTAFNLALRNLAASGFRSGAIFLCAALVAGLSLSATLVVRGAEGSLRNSLDRLGAEMVVVPFGTMTERDREDARLMSMSAGHWMPRQYMERIAAVEGVEAVSPQLYLATIPGASFTHRAEAHLLAYEPETDFTLKPWLKEPVTALKRGEAVIGSAITPIAGSSLYVFGYALNVVSRLESTGTGLDSAVFVSFETAEYIALQESGKVVPRVKVAPQSISAVLVRLELGRDPREVSVTMLREVKSVTPVESAGMFQQERLQLTGLLRGVLAILGTIWMLAVVFMGMVFSLAANERRRQIGVLIALGAPQNFILRSLLAEGVLLAVGGGVVGILLGWLGMFLFHDALEGSLGLPLTIPPVPELMLLALAGMVLALASVTLAVYFPARRISRQEPALTLRE